MRQKVLELAFGRRLRTLLRRFISRQKSARNGWVLRLSRMMRTRAVMSAMVWPVSVSRVMSRMVRMFSMFFLRFFLFHFLWLRRKTSECHQLWWRFVLIHGLTLCRLWCGRSGHWYVVDRRRRTRLLWVNGRHFQHKPKRFLFGSVGLEVILFFILFFVFLMFSRNSFSFHLLIHFWLIIQIQFN